MNTCEKMCGGWLVGFSSQLLVLSRPKKAVRITAFFRHKWVGPCTPLARALKREETAAGLKPGATSNAERLRECPRKMQRARRGPCPLV